MRNGIYGIYKKEIDKITKNSGVIAIFLVGSSKNKNFVNHEEKVNDIDLFVVKEGADVQERIIKNIDGVDFDINYFSYELCEKMIDKQELFFISEMKDAKVLYDISSMSNKLIKDSISKFEKGPMKLTKKEISYLKKDIHTRLSNLENIEEKGSFEYQFLTDLLLKDIIIGYFNIKGRWVPKDKKLIKKLYNNEVELYKLYEKAYFSKSYTDLREIYIYVFKDEDIEDFIKLIY